MRYALAIVTLAVVVVPGGPVSAQQTAPTKPDTTARDDAAAERKSPGRALLYSVGGTVLLTPILVGPIVGPSFGHFYAEDNGAAWRGIALRSGGVLLAGTVLLWDFASFSHVGTSWEDYVGNIALYAVLAHALYDSITAWHAATEYNEAHDVRARVTPTVGPHGEHVGLVLRVSF